MGHVKSQILILQGGLGGGELHGFTKLLHLLANLGARPFARLHAAPKPRHKAWIIQCFSTQTRRGDPSFAQELFNFGFELR
ncbi:hypothetical protein PhaeoP75_02321 [Phaeobacter gallaeciensis]|uniref:Uncharacterized protein n=1 Tax=Phaeobacter gallaeciensis TaxID=60890 RepID=A0AAD0EDH0_9RHOB|nr:hypothetical protein Gal_02281 [Phaeobacter gallaeciensis DSM 26640]ATE93292.1 hypothetical protein PhaeoP11_02272 [Phaeobacter gallaeciensis]ATE96887.1 hypothetical protein PhaeoP73_01575 [Phaeobacter gallaeciensis]ATF01956.1 hypothetical protein PhaeoP75_02321 [Phaeobacter gallaeciensis]ATF06336.1 hypothetical protein PhaeoP63_02270 [Phaeobacter gallaeciensis]